MRSIIGWDIGGAHLKAARIEGGVVVDVVQVPCPLWLGLDRLTEALDVITGRLGTAHSNVATMTGELADVFADRAEGVATLTARVARHLHPAELRVFGGRAGFLTAETVAQHVDDIASANWHASASLMALRCPHALFVDMGSTTTDIVPIRAGALRAIGYTDAERLACGELVYTGLTRSFVMALGPRVPFAGGWTTLACEYFASTADVYRILGELPEDADQLPTADHREKTVSASIARLARMIGCDAGHADAAAWRGLAAFLAEMQLRQIIDGTGLVLSRAELPPDAPVIAAGVGSRVIGRLAARLSRQCVDFASLVTRDTKGQEWLTSCAPAVAVALLADHADGASA
ncbi:MAG TPA: hydantoinase/oxoprolinase family protein [Acetobacteraceae bacterium]|nr:hydantoinase/oxoprolinase family protein [Acetobacteraceae bacterium]